MTEKVADVRLHDDKDNPNFEGKTFVAIESTGVGHQVKLKLSNGDWIRPFGNYVILEIEKTPEKTKSGLYLTDAMKSAKEIVSRVGKVAAMGVTAYMGDRFPYGPWTTPGEWVMFRKYDAQDFDIALSTTEKIPFVILYDDKLMMAVSRPDLIDTTKAIGH